jgi:hypothetical protein
MNKLNIAILYCLFGLFLLSIGACSGPNPTAGSPKLASTLAPTQIATDTAVPTATFTTQPTTTVIPSTAPSITPTIVPTETLTPTIAPTPTLGVNSPGTYNIGRCLLNKFFRDRDEITVCVTTVEVRMDGKMVFNVAEIYHSHITYPAHPEWVSGLHFNAKSLLHTQSRYLVDDTGYKYFVVEVQGVFTADYEMKQDIPVVGAFVFEPARPKAVMFSFVDEENQLTIDWITLKPK